MTDDKESEFHEPFGGRAVDWMLRERMGRATRLYRQALNHLWLGNAGAAIATLGFLGGTWRQAAPEKTLLWPLGFFVLGLICMGLGSLVALVREGRSISDLQDADSILDIKVRSIESPRESVGLDLGNWQSRLAILSGVLFVVGCVVGFFLLVVAALPYPPPTKPEENPWIPLVPRDGSSTAARHLGKKDRQR